MNKYEDIWNKTEGKKCESYKMKYSLKFYQYIFKHCGVKDTKLLFKRLKFNVPYLMLQHYSLFSDRMKIWSKYNILNELNLESVISLYIQNINNAITENDDKSRDLCIKSFIELGIIKDIKLKEDNVILLTLWNDDEYNIVKLLNSKDEIKSFRHKCHKVCYEYFMIYGDVNANVVTVLEKNLYNQEQYHSFVVKDNIVLDYARNIIMSYDKYISLFNPKVIMNINGIDMLNKINELENIDNDFKKLNDWYPVLKLALYNLIQNSDLYDAKILKKS